MLPRLVAALRPPPAPVKKYVDAAELARTFGVARRTIENWKRQPEFPFLCAPGTRAYRFDVDAVRKWLEARRP